MRASEDVYVEWVEDEAVVLHRRSGEVHYLNPTAATVLAFLEEHGYERGVAEVARRFGIDPAEHELQELLRDFTATGILVDGTQDAAAKTEGSETGEPRAAPG